MRSSPALFAAVVSVFAFASYAAHAQPAEPAQPEQEPSDAVLGDDAGAPVGQDRREEEERPPIGGEPAQEAPVVVAPADPMRTEVPAISQEPEAEEPPMMSEGRMLVSLYNSGFHWGIAPGVVFSRGKAGFALGLRFGYGFDTGSVILVPGVRLSGYFVDPNVYLGMPTFKLVLPIDRFAPFVEGGAGVGHVAGANSTPAETGAALMGGGGFMIHFSRVAFGAEASYQVITGTPFKGFGVGPILAIGF